MEVHALAAELGVLTAHVVRHVEALDHIATGRVRLLCLEREQELLFRGKQYARAISLFQRRYGRYPNTLKELYENNPRTIRKLWKDPICDCGDWDLLILNSPDANPLSGMGVPAALAPPGRLRTPTPTPTPPRRVRSSSRISARRRSSRVASATTSSK